MSTKKSKNYLYLSYVKKIIFNERFFLFRLRNLELQIANITSRQAAEDRNRRSFGSFFKNNLTLSIVGAGAALIYFIFKDLS